MMRKTTLALAFAAALGTGVAVAQTSPGAERQPAGAPNVGDTRAIPGPDQRPLVSPRTMETAPGSTATPADRQINPAGQPNAGDARAIPSESRANEPRAMPNDSRRADGSRRTWRDRFLSRGPESPSPTAQSWERGGHMGPYGSGLGSPQFRFDGPEQGRFVEPVKV
jgi:hypothetical protein